MSGLAGRKALITGGAAGIGASVARGLAERGAAVVIADAPKIPRRRAEPGRHGCNVDRVSAGVLDPGIYVCVDRIVAEP